MAVKPYVDPEQLQSDLSFTLEDLDSANMEQASLYAHYAELYVRAQYQYDSTKAAQEIIEAKLDQEIRDLLAADPKKKITEGVVAAEIKRHPKYLQTVKAVNESRMYMALAKESLEAFKQRRDMLVQVGVQRREEMKGDLLIKSKHAELDAMKEKRQALLDKMSR